MNQKPDWKNLLSGGQKLVDGWKKFLSDGRKQVIDWKSLLHKGLPYALAIIFATATYLSVVGVKSTNADFISLQGTRNELETQKQALATSQKELEGVLSETKTLVNQLTSLNSDMQSLLEKAESEGGAVSDKIEELENALENVEQKEQQRWLIPMQYTFCASPYGYRTHPVAGESKFHYGVDLSADKGTPIVASRSGTVVLATYDDSSGNYVVIDHLDGYRSVYMHMEKYIVAEGQFVVAGQIIGYCGSTGISTGDHLHFGIYQNGQTVNPADYIDMY